jgi:hypothetical protein
MRSDLTLTVPMVRDYEELGVKNSPKEYYQTYLEIRTQRIC